MGLDSSVTFKCDEDFRAWLARESMELDKSVSELVRSALILAVPQIKAIRGLDRVCLEDIRTK
jgi:hypothetical protein